MSNFWDRAADWVNRMFPFGILVVCHFGFEIWTVVLIAPVPWKMLTFYFTL